MQINISSTEGFLFAHTRDDLGFAFSFYRDEEGFWHVQSASINGSDSGESIVITAAEAAGAQPAVPAGRMLDALNQAARELHERQCQDGPTARLQTTIVPVEFYEPSPGL